MVWRRLRLYLFGVLLGTVLVYVFVLRKHDIAYDAWLPAKRIMRDMRNDDRMTGSARYQCLVACRALTEAQMTSLFTEGKLENLRPGGDPYRYRITWSDSTGTTLVAGVEKPGNDYILVHLEAGENTVPCHCEGASEAP
ncbi:MAG: hypothetical protein AAGB22_00255 [Bacteroidota bacterium]